VRFHFIKIYLSAVEIMMLKLFILEMYLLEGKRPLGRPRRRWVDNIRMGLGEVGWSDVDWIGLAQDRNRWRALVNSVLNLRVP
jgi:predicted small integral membrane protein